MEIIEWARGVERELYELGVLLKSQVIEGLRSTAGICLILSLPALFLTVGYGVAASQIPEDEKTWLANNWGKVALFELALFVVSLALILVLPPE